MGNHLRAFLQAWLDWAEADAPDSLRRTTRNPYGFDRDVGLCSNTHRFEERELGIELGYTGGLEVELGYLFESQGMSNGYPFGQAAYDADADDGTHHTNSARLAWVREQLA